MYTTLLILFRPAGRPHSLHRMCEFCTGETSSTGQDSDRHNETLRFLLETHKWPCPWPTPEEMAWYNDGADGIILGQRARLTDHETNLWEVTFDQHAGLFFYEL